MSVDLAAVRAARAALAALVTAHPELRDADPRDAVATLDDEEETREGMPPKLDPDSDRGAEVIAVRMTPDLLEALDREVARRREENPDVAIGRSNVLRSLVRRALLAPAPVASTTAPKAPRKVPAKSESDDVRAHVIALRATLSAAEIGMRAGVSDETVNKALRGGSISTASRLALMAVPVP